VSLSYGVTAEEEITQSFYEKSKQYTDVSKLENEELIKYGLQLSHECTIELSSGFKRRKSFYEDFIEDSTTLNNLCKTEPLKYKRGILEIEASHSAKCRVSCQGEIDSVLNETWVVSYKSVLPYPFHIHQSHK
jgi:hypothetical protein